MSRGYRDVRKGIGTRSIDISVQYYLKTFECRYPYGYRYARKGIGIQKPQYTNERRSLCGLRPKRPAKAFGKIVPINLHSQMFAGMLW